jgi:hypothetical protein
MWFIVTALALFISKSIIVAFAHHFDLIAKVFWIGFFAMIAFALLKEPTLYVISFFSSLV